MRIKKPDRQSLGNILLDHYKLILAILLSVISIVFAVYFVYTATTRQLTEVEGVSLQTITWVTGIVASLVFGRMSAAAAARELIRPHARSAFRRIISLYNSISRVAKTVADAQESDQSKDHSMALARVQAMVTEQLSNADDALEDWRDVIPEAVDELWRPIDQRMEGEDHDG